MREVFWIGSSKTDLKAFPEKVRKQIGRALYQVQIGDQPAKAKPLKGFSGVWEITSDFDTNTFRAVYATKIGDYICVLHCFQKKSKRGIQTPKKEIELVRRRLKIARGI